MSVLAPGERVLVPTFGRFGHLLVEIAGRCGAEVPAIEAERRTVFDPAQIEAAVTNVDGRTNQPMLEWASFKPGPYELVFAVSAYFRSAGIPMGEPPFLDHVPVRFTIADGAGHYHVPLLVSPWSYTTYRGS